MSPETMLAHQVNRANLGDAMLVGDASLLRRTANAQMALFSILEQHDLDASQRDGVFQALDELAAGLSRRAEVVEDHLSAAGAK